MTCTIELTSEEEARKTQKALDPHTLLSLPKEVRSRILQEQAERAAAEYEADLALPANERELTAFTALDDEPIYDYTDRSVSHAA